MSAPTTGPTVRIDGRLLRALFGMARPLQLVAVTLVYGLGVLMALASGAALDWAALVWAYAALIPTSMSIHYANEYADYETDALTARTPFSGGSGALQRTGVPRQVGLVAAWSSLVLGSGIALAGYMAGGIGLAALGMLAFGAFFGWMYSLPPLKLAWHGWGELDNALLGGVALPVYGAVVQWGALDGRFIVAALPFGLLVYANLLATTWPDRQADAQVGKYTLATRWPTGRLRLLYAGAIVLFIGLLAVLAGQILPPKVAWWSLGVVPLALLGATAYTRIRNPLPTVAAMVALLLVQIGAWACVGDTLGVLGF